MPSPADFDDFEIRLDGEPTDVESLPSGHGFTPPGFAPCTREDDHHDGPCAHPFAQPMTAAEAQAFGVLPEPEPEPELEVVEARRDPLCEMLARHRSNCTCAGTMRDPI